MKVYGRGAAGPDGVVLPVRRTAAGALVVSGTAFPEAAPPLADVLDAAAGRIVCDVRNDPADADFDAPAEATAHLLVALLAGRPAAGIVVASEDWYAVEVARAAGLRTAFVTPPEVTLGAALAYVTDAGHPECHPHHAGLRADPDALALARDAGVEVVVRGVARADLDALRALGVAGAVLDDD